MTDETPRTVELSTGHEVTLPLSTTATMVGAVFTAAVDAARPLLPDALAPVRITPARTGVLLLGVEYHRIDRGQLDPYDEFGIFIPAVPADRAGAVSALTGGLGGYTWQLPVTTEPARALGDVWGYPKSVADISFTDLDSHRQARVAVDGKHVLTLDVARPRTIPAAFGARSYTDTGETVRKVPVRIDGEVGAGPRGSPDALTLGDHPWADHLRVLGAGSRPLCRVSFEGEFVISPPVRIG